MPEYGFKCGKHGEFSVWQPMLVNHKANCPKCGATAKRQYFAASLTGDLPYKKSCFSWGKDRETLYQNLATEGLESKDTWKYDKHQREEELIRKQKTKNPISIYAK